MACCGKRLSRSSVAGLESALDEVFSTERFNLSIEADCILPVNSRRQ